MNVFSFTLAGVFLLALQTVVTVHILLHKDDVPSAIGWMGLVWLAPVIGSVAYILLGINRIRRKASRLHNHGLSDPPATFILAKLRSPACQRGRSLPAYVPSHCTSAQRSLVGQLHF